MKGELRGSIAGWSKLLTSYDGESIDYDEIGNPVSYRGATLTWDGRELKTYSKNGTNISYKYDADGLRASKTVNGAKTTYQYVDGQLLYEDRNGTDIYYYYDSYGTPTAIRYYLPNGTSYRFILATNSLGDVTGIYNMSGNLVVKYEYDAWGRIISTTNATGGALTGTAAVWNEINPFRYRGYYYDAETELYYLQSRYYDAETGRFVSSDDTNLVLVAPTLLTDKNYYLYCDNNPIIREDPTGRFWNTVIGITSGAVIGGLSAAITGGDVGAGVVGGIISGLCTGAAIDITIASGGASLGIFAMVVGTSGMGSSLGSMVNQYMSYRTLEGIDWGTVAIDGFWGAIAGAVSYGTAGIGTSSCQTLNQIFSQSAKKIGAQAVEDFCMDLATSWGTWYNGSVMNYPRTRTSSTPVTPTPTPASSVSNISYNKAITVYEYQMPQYHYKYGRLQ